MHISIYIPLIQPGGAELKSIDLANQLIECNHKVTFISSVINRSDWNKLDGRINCIHLTRHSQNKLGRMLDKLYAIARLSRHYSSDKPDAILSFLDQSITIAWLSRKLSGHKPFLASAQTYIVKKTEKSLFSLSYFFKHALTDSDVIIVPSNGVARSLVDVYGIDREKCAVIPNGIDIEEIQSKKNASTDFQPKKGRFTISAISRLVEHKGLNDLLQTFSILVNFYDVELIIIGDGPLRNTLENTAARLNIKDRVQITGFLENPFSIVSKTDLFIQASHSEGFGTVLIEAMACGVPVIAAKCEGGIAEEILEMGKWGDLFERGSPESMLKAIRNNIEKKKLIDTTQRAQDFSLELMVFSYIRTLEKYRET